MDTEKNIKKAIKVIMSCKNMEQLEITGNWIKKIKSFIYLEDRLVLAYFYWYKKELLNEKNL